jgi:hypothetical protein
MICSAEILAASGVKSTSRCRTELRNASISSNRSIFGAAIAAEKSLIILQHILQKTDWTLRNVKYQPKCAIGLLATQRLLIIVPFAPPRPDRCRIPILFSVR